MDTFLFLRWLEFNEVFGCYVLMKTPHSSIETSALVPLLKFSGA